MALEQSITCDTKSKGGLVGMTNKDDAVGRRFWQAMNELPSQDQ